MPTQPEHSKDAAKKTEAKRPASQAPAKGQAGQKAPTKPAGKPAPTPAPSSLFDEELPALESPDVMGLPPVSDASSLFDTELPSLDSPSADSLSPLDMLLSDPSLAAAAATASPLQPTVKKRAAVDPRTVKIIAAVGAGVAALLLIVVLIVTLGGSDGSEQLAKANERYEAGDYAAAVAQYDEFLQSYPRHAEAEPVRVRRGVAKICLAGADKQWPAAFDTAIAVLDEIAPLGGFEEAVPRLTTPLPAIVAGLAADVRVRPDPAVVAKGLDLLARIERALPEADLSVQRLDKAERSLGRAAYELARAQERETALTAMKGAAALDEVYRLRRALLAQYPELTDDGELRAVAEAAAERHLPKWTAAEKEEALPSAAPPEEVTVTLVLRDFKKAVPGADKYVWTVPYGGAIYALTATDGRVLWRRFVGVDVHGTTLPAVAVSDQPDSDLLIVDQRRRSLERIEAASGRVRWRRALEAEAVGPPVIAGPFTWQAVRDRKLPKIVLESGEPAGHLLLPQPPATAPAVDVTRKLLLVPGEQLDLYATDLNGGKPQVFPLGHEFGCVRFAPAIAEGFAIVVVDHGLSRYRLHIFALGAPPQMLRRVQELPLLGRVERPFIAGTMFDILQTDGKLLLYHIAAAEKASPLQPGEKTKVHDMMAARVARALPTGGTIVEGAYGGVERDEQYGGCVVSVHIRPSPELHWQTHLAVPLAGGPHAVEGGKCRVVSAAGDLYELTAGDLPAVLEKPLISAPRDAAGVALTDSVGLSDGTIVATGPAGSSQLTIYGASPDAAAPARFAVPGGLACPPIVLGDALIAATRSGHVFAVDPRKRKIVAALPLMSLSDAEEAMRSAHLIARSDEQCDVVDARGKPYRIVFRAKPTPSLELTPSSEPPAEATAAPALPAELSTLKMPFVGAPRALGDHWLAAGLDGTLYLVKKQ